MEEEGIDLSDRVLRMLTDEPARWADVVITMGCGDACPVIPGKRYIDWDLRVPKDLPLDEVRAIRDDIKARVVILVKDLLEYSDSVTASEKQFRSPGQLPEMMTLPE